MRQRAVDVKKDRLDLAWQHTRRKTPAVCGEWTRSPSAMHTQPPNTAHLHLAAVIQPRPCRSSVQWTVQCMDVQPERGSDEPLIA
jgi:hypothetical protein